jgi:CDP-glycerol glycerophosphotransferase (TagB/SpsB family)
VNIVSKNKSVQSTLEKVGVESSLMPAFPKTVIMARHALHKFPYKKITKIGMRHGAYHFKKMISKEKYNAFDMYFFTSDKELEIAEELGFTSGAVGGFPKLDDAFNGSITTKELVKLRKAMRFDNKPIILFSATWEKSGMSAVKRWNDRLYELTKEYNILVTLHPFTNSKIKQKLRRTLEIHFIEDKEILPYLMLADLLISDTSSIIAEFCALNKPIITFRTQDSHRLTKEIKSMLGEISEQINTFDELKSILPEVLTNPSKKQEQRQFYNTIMFGKLDGKHAQRMANTIIMFNKKAKNKEI